MTPSTLVIAWRFFLASKRSMFLSALGIVFGVAFFICGQAQTQGFQDYFIKTILGSKGAIVVSDRFQKTFTRILSQKGDGNIMVSNPQSRKYYPGINDAARIIRALKEYPNVAACSPVLEDKVVLRVGGFQSDVASVWGIDIPQHTSTTDLAGQVIEGSFLGFSTDTDGLLVGSGIARRFDLYVGQSIHVSGPQGDSRRFRITGIYETGVNAIDEKRIYVHQRTAQLLLRSPYLVSFILVKLHDPARAPQDAAAFEEHFGHTADAWQDRERGNLQLFRTLRLSAGLAITCIILLAGFGIFNVMTMSVFEKTKEIAILRSMGYSRRDIEIVFLWQGVMVACIGIALGWGFGALLTEAVTHIPIRIRGMLKADHFIVSWSIQHYLSAAFLGMLSALLASYIPARRAARLDPVNILRGQNQ